MLRSGHLKLHHDSLRMCTLQGFVYLTWQMSGCHLHVQLCQCSVVSFTVIQDLHSNTPTSLFSITNALKRSFQQLTVSADRSLRSCSGAPSSGGRRMEPFRSFPHKPHAAPSQTFLCAPSSGEGWITSFLLRKRKLLILIISKKDYKLYTYIHKYICFFFTFSSVSADQKRCC